MNANKLTQKSLEAVQTAQSLAIEHSNVQIEQEHLVSALLEQPEGLIPSLVKKMGCDLEALRAAVRQRIEGMPGVSGPGREPDKIYVSQEVDQALSLIHI